MGHLAGQHLPACELREINEAIAVSVELGGGAVEGVGRDANFIRPVIRYADFEIAASQAFEGAGQVHDGAAEAGGDEPDEREGHHPDKRGEKTPGDEETAAEVAGGGLA